jgi:hypothetical protein
MSNFNLEHANNLPINECKEYITKYKKVTRPIGIAAKQKKKQLRGQTQILVRLGIYPILVHGR